MEKNTSIETLRIVGGHPALDFANTLVSRRDRYGPEMLHSYDDLRHWSLRVGLIDADRSNRLRRLAEADEGAAAASFADALALREAVYGVGSALAAGSVPPPDALELLSRVAQKARATHRLVVDGGVLRWDRAGIAELDGIHLTLAEAAADLFTQTERLPRLKECFGRNCGWLFLDTSRNGRRRWCCEADCGTPARVRRHRARKREEPVPGTA